MRYVPVDGELELLPGPTPLVPILMLIAAIVWHMGRTVIA